MPPHLHPRSTATSTLFAGTLLASFVVVAIPHLIPCPRPNGRGHLNTEIKLDENGKPIRRIRRNNQSKSAVEEQSLQNLPTSTSMQTPKSISSEAAMFEQLRQEAEVLKTEQNKDRECPVPKPRGVVGKWLGFDGGKAVDVGKA